jgi:hypothetical protein
MDEQKGAQRQQVDANWKAINAGLAAIGLGNAQPSVVWISAVFIFGVPIIGALLLFAADLDLVSAWKTMSIGVTGAFGVLGLLTEFKDKEKGKITKWGKTSLVGIVASSCLGMAAEFKETSDKELQRQKAANEALALAKKTDAGLVELTRVLSPLDDFSLLVRLNVNCGVELYQRFCAQIKEKSNEFRQHFPDAETADDGAVIPTRIVPRVSSNSTNKVVLVPLGVWILGSSSWWSSWPEWSAFGKHVTVTLDVRIFSKGTEIVSAASAHNSKENLHFSVAASTSQRMSNNELKMRYDFEADRLDIFINGRVENLTRDNNLLSIVDLNGSTMVIYGSNDALADMKITSFVIKTGRGQVIDIDSTKLVNDSISWNIYRFP